MQINSRGRRSSFLRVAASSNAWIKQVLGFRQFSFRGIDKVRSEFKLVCAALNLRRMATMTA